MVLNKRTMESLIKSGAFDSLDHPRQGLCLVFEEIVDRTLERRREEQAGISTLFSTLEGFGDPDGGDALRGLRRPPRARCPTPSSPRPSAWPSRRRCSGLYVSDHPLRGFEAAVARLTDCSIADLKDIDDGPTDGSGRDGQVRTIGGVVTGLVRRYTKRGELMATFVLEDLRASIEVFVFPKVMAEIGALLADDAVFVVRGRLDTRDDQVKLVCMEAHRPQLAADGVGELRVELPLGVLTDPVVDRLKAAALGAPWQRARVPPRGPVGPAPPGRVQRGQPAGAARRAADAARPERHRGLTACADRGRHLRSRPSRAARVGQGSPRPVSWWVPPSR